MTDVANDVRGRGRPRQFDEEQVLDSLVDLFWERGYEDASVSEIADAAGLNKSSLYNSFGSKDELFFAVIDRYMDFRLAMLDQSLDSDGGLEQVEQFIEFMRIECTSDGGARGCLAVNACTELGLRDERAAALASRYRAMLGDKMRAALKIAESRDEIGSGMVDVYADVIVGFAISVAVASRSGAPLDELNRQIDSLSNLVNGWRI